MSIDNADDPTAEALSHAAKPPRDIVGPTKPRTVDRRPVPVGFGQSSSGYEYGCDPDGNLISIEHVETTELVGSHFTWDYYARRKEQRDD